MSQSLFESLREYCDSDFYPFHMPGHKGNPQSGALAEFNHFDITEIDGFDNLHQPQSLIRDAQERAARLYHSEETYFLVNGSTAGILSAVASVAGWADKLIISRNCHRAVYHAAFLNRLELCYLYPDRLEGCSFAGPVTARETERVIREILVREKKKPEEAGRLIAGVVITSPTYEGIVSDVEEIAELVHRYGIALIVDQAHGAHFGIHPDYPENAVAQGADLVIHSVHKTLPAPTQTALIHRNGFLTKGELLQRYLRIYQSSSPSYLLMAGIDEALSLVQKQGRAGLERVLSWRELFLNGTKHCRHIRVCPFTEPGKLVIEIKDFPAGGQILYDLLRERYHLQMEMASGNYVVAILTMMDREEGVRRLLRALQESDSEIGKAMGKALRAGHEKIGSRKPEDGKEWDQEGQSAESVSCTEQWGMELCPQVKLPLWEAYRMPYREAALTQAQGETAAEFINLYPPGIPILVPGERVERAAIEKILFSLQSGYTVQGVCEGKIKVIQWE